MAPPIKVFAVALCLMVAVGCSQTGGSDEAAGPPREPPISSPRRERGPSGADRARGQAGRGQGDFDPREVRITLALVADGFESPLLVTHAGDGSGRLFVAEQGGRIFELRGRGVAGRPFLDISELTEPVGEQGLLGLAFHPRYEDNGRLFVNYTDNSGDTVIAEYRATSRHRANPRSARTLLTFDQPYPNHNGGGLAFGPDGYLYVATGDGGGAGDPHGNGQSLDTLLGKLLRIDVDTRSRSAAYSVPADNPFVDRAGARPEIWAYGLRNPWRFSFDRVTGDLWVGDVGQSNLEEIDRAPGRRGRGANYGWNVMEGTSCYAAEACDRGGLVLPITQYGHDDGCSVTGGYVYRGRHQPELAGGYFFGDYCSGKVWVIDAAARRLVRPTELLDTEYAVSSFGESEAGELYATDLAGGRVLQLRAAP
jgi:glucose/arabinose dehydrogenase